jgi:hypothetical protein
MMIAGANGKAALDIEAGEVTLVTILIDASSSIAGRNLTRAEWRQFFPSRPYHATCAA